MKLSTEQTANTGFLNSLVGSIGWAARVSTQQNSASATTPPANRPRITGEPQAYSLPPQLVARISALAPTATSPMPVKSMIGRPAARTAGMLRAAAITTITAIGTLM